MELTLKTVEYRKEEYQILVAVHFDKMQIHTQQANPRTVKSLWVRLLMGIICQLSKLL